MNKDTLKAIFTMLETGSDKELDNLRAQLVIASEGATTDEGRSEIRFALRLLDEEITARSVVPEEYRQR